MSRVMERKIEGYMHNLSNGHVTTVPGGYEWVSVTRSSITRTPEHRARLRGEEVWVPPTPYQATAFTRSINPLGYISIPALGVGFSGRIDNAGWPDVYLGAPSLFGVYDEGLFKIRERIKDQNIQFGASIAESRQTIDMIARSAKAVASSLNDLRKGNLKGAVEDLRLPWNAYYRSRMKKPRRLYRGPAKDGATRKLADRWLELQFGWKPLLSDIDGAARKLADDATANPTRNRFKVVATVRKPFEKRVVTSVDSGNPVYNEFAQVNQGSRGYRFVVYYSIGNRALAEAARSGLVDIADTAWEVVPFSFVVDWAFPVGKVLNSMTATMGKEFIAGTCTEFTELVARTEQVLIRSPWSDHICSNVGAKAKHMYMDRSVLSTFPAMPMIHLKNPFSVTHALDALALLSQSAFKAFH